MRPIRASLWYDGNAEDAARFYCGVFPDAAITDVQRYTEAGPGEPGSVVSVAWRIGDREFVGINGGPEYTFSPAISFVAECDGQAEVDRLWEALLADGGRPSMCGWLEDRFGVSWQVVPTELFELIRDPRGAGAMLRQVKIDLAEIRAAVAGASVGGS
jgi:predicted 3-demethylubiquinone-9 3-methyltransferase (glyoxalase superfamily)